ncbi:hypothetical protein C8R44DRAFT_893805 [Mycena epipterygia]|nr:hypothetical protein C8R44DRAFT_893805 [Mycena epipterygia]
MAVTKHNRRTLPFSRPTILRPVRAVRLAPYSALDRWIAATDINPDSELRAPLPDEKVMCEIFVAVIEGIQGILAPVYLLSMTAYDSRAGKTAMLRLARFAGSPGDAAAPLWVRRLPPRKFLCFTQPRAFAARLVGGLTEILSNQSFPQIKCPLRCSLGHATLLLGLLPTESFPVVARMFALRNLKVWARGNNLRDLKFR